MGRGGRHESKTLANCSCTMPLTKFLKEKTKNTGKFLCKALLREFLRLSFATQKRDWKLQILDEENVKSIPKLRCSRNDKRIINRFVIRGIVIN